VEKLSYFSGEQLELWSKILSEKLIVTQLDNKFLAFYGIRMVNTVFTGDSI